MMKKLSIVSMVSNTLPQCKCQYLEPQVIIKNGCIMAFLIFRSEKRLIESPPSPVRDVCLAKKLGFDELFSSKVDFLVIYLLN